jgi:7-carboxy-7-deazaguanine synthase
MNYPVNEIFQTVQGEATHTGTPAVFVRVQGCPVGCGWCDTKQTWDVPADHPRLSVEDIVRAVGRFAARHVVITGGEPCLYDLNPLLAGLAAAGYGLQIETSGVYPIQVPDSVWVTVSPKVGMPGGTCRADSLARADEIKMPVGKPRDVETLLGLPVPEGKPVWVQPLSESPAATRLCIEAATEHGWRVSFQVHKLVGLP